MSVPSILAQFLSRATNQKCPTGQSLSPKPTTLPSLKSSFNFVTLYQMNPLTKFRVIVKILEVKPSSPLPILVEENV